MNVLNEPVEMISVFGKDGIQRPLRFRLEAEDHTLVTVRMRRIKSMNRIQVVGIEGYQYVCTAVIGGSERTFELRYSIRNHRWVLYRFLCG